MADTKWQVRAACRSVDPELFFPLAETGPVFEQQVGAAKAVCARCPVRRECLAEALERIPCGVAGGLTEQERRRLLRPSPRTARLRGREPAATGRELLAAGLSRRVVARRCEVSLRTVERWAAGPASETSAATSGASS